jgi:predicted MFS family arabinose efflux permease
VLFGNFVIGCGVMAPAGVLNDLAASLAISVALAGQLITIGAVVMGLGAPLLASTNSGQQARLGLAEPALAMRRAAGHPRT